METMIFKAENMKILKEKVKLFSECKNIIIIRVIYSHEETETTEWYKDTIQDVTAFVYYHEII